MFGLLSFLLAGALPGASAMEEAGSLYVSSPPALKEKFPPDGKIAMSPAMFGTPSYQARVITALTLYAPATDQDGCEEINKTAIAGWPANGPVVLMADRGTCTFVTKTKHAQDIGASAIVIVDNRDEDWLPYMADDGNGNTIQIPAMLIHKNDGALIKKFVDEEMEANRPVILALKWDYANDDNIVEWEMWTGADDDGDALQFKSVFSEAVKVLGTNATFTPHIFQYFMPWCREEPDDPMCEDVCTNKGRYCIGSQSAPNAYRVIQENVRSLCVFQTVNATGEPDKWFDYASQVTKDCAADMYLGSCSTGIMRGLGINEQAVQKCIDASGGFGQDTDADNSILEGERRAQADKNILFRPTVLVNGFHYSNSLVCPTPIDTSHCGVLNAICKGFKDRQLVAACMSDPGCPLGQVTDPAGVCGGTCTFDSCNQCTEAKDPKRNQCVGCDGVAYSGKVFDDCDPPVCGGPGRDKCGECLPLDDPSRIPVGSDQKCTGKSHATGEDTERTVTKQSGMKAWQIVLVVLGCMAAVGILVFLFMQHRQRQLKEDIDALLKQYLPMDAEAGGRQEGGAVSTL